MADINIYNSSFYEYLNPSQNKYGNLELISSPVVQVVTTAELKSQLRIDTSDEDTLLATYISAATQMAEHYCNRHFIEHRYRIWFDELPDKFSLYFPDVTVKFLGGNINPGLTNDGLYYYSSILQNYTQYALSNYYISNKSNPCTFTRSSVFSAPGYIRNQDDVQGDDSPNWYFQYTTGFGNTVSAVPDAIKQAIKLIASDMYYFREDRKRTFPMASEILLQPYKCYL